MKLKISDKHFIVAGLASVLGWGFYLFDVTGFRTLAAIILFFFLPFYLIIRKTSMETDEKIFFSFFIGIGLFSTLVFYVGRVIPSYKMSTAIAFVVLMLIPSFLRKIKK